MPYFTLGFFIILSLISHPVSAETKAALNAGINSFTYGVMQQDVESNPIEDSISINLEVLFATKLKSIPWSPQPVIGATINTEDDTNQLYGGMAWQYDFSERFYTEIFLGGAIHDGEDDPDTSLAGGREAHRAYGCPLNFRESLSFGWHLSTQFSLMATVSHISNARLCDENDGLTNAGIRISRRY
jgi:lipid A 3-O-deacylase